MIEIFEKIFYYFSFPMVVNAFMVALLVAVCSSLLGVPLVLKRFSFIGDGLSHVAFGAMAVATVLQIASETPLVLAITVIAAVLLLRSGQKAKIKGDAALAMISVGALAIGYLLLNIFPKGGNLAGDVCTTLFGATSVLFLKESDVILCIILSVAVVAMYIFFYNRIFQVTFDENFAGATGTKTGLYNLLIAVISAVIIVLGMKLVGSLLVSALVVFPVLSSMRVFKTFKSVTICSVILSVFCTVSGLLISILADTPLGATIVAADIVVFGIFTLIGVIGKGRGR